MDANTDVWTFPQEIEFWLVPDYLKRIEGSTFKNRIVFDLSETENVHSSFIGFLIFVKQSAEKHRGKLVLKVSPSMKKRSTGLLVDTYWSDCLLNELTSRKCSQQLMNFENKIIKESFINEKGNIRVRTINSFVKI